MDNSRNSSNGSIAVEQREMFAQTEVAIRQSVVFHTV